MLTITPAPTYVLVEPLDVDKEEGSITLTDITRSRKRLIRGEIRIVGELVLPDFLIADELLGAKSPAVAVLFDKIGKTLIKWNNKRYYLLRYDDCEGIIHVDTKVSIR